MAQLARRLRFGLLERVALPLGIAPMRALMRTWRLEVDDVAQLQPFADCQRMVVATCHGMLLHVLAFTRLPSLRGRRFVVLLSPSRDGRLLAAFLARFGVGHAVGMTGVRGVAGAHAFARRVRAGEVGVIAIDGPRGPCCQVSPGFLRIAAAAGAETHLAVTTADHGITFGSWDRAHLPAPFARVRLCLQPLADATSLLETQTRLVRIARALRSPVLPYELRAPG